MPGASCEGLAGTLEGGGFAPFCFLLCEWFRSWRCMLVCLPLCRVFPLGRVESEIGEMIEWQTSSGARRLLGGFARGQRREFLRPRTRSAPIQHAASSPTEMSRITKTSIVPPLSAAPSACYSTLAVTLAEFEGHSPFMPPTENSSLPASLPRRSSPSSRLRCACST